jgi:hypothetical protein
MHSLDSIVGRNDRAVIREHAAALEDGNLALAERIRIANPDLFRRPVQRVQSQTETKVKTSRLAEAFLASQTRSRPEGK